MGWGMGGMGRRPFSCPPYSVISDTFVINSFLPWIRFAAISCPKFLRQSRTKHAMFCTQR